jgi:hypothetical protein
MQDKQWYFFWAAILAFCIGAFLYSAHLQSGAHWITKVLCEDRQVFRGQYRRCLEHYEPATKGLVSTNGTGAPL